MSAKKRQGIFLISVLFITLLITMFLGAAMVMSPLGLAQTGQAAAQDNAERAAMVGVEYVMTRLRENPNFCFGGNAPPAQGEYVKVTVNTPEMFVQEENGNIVGLLWDGNHSNISQFRVRFNYQDAQPNTASEQLSDPSAKMLIDLPYVSVNNAPGYSDAVVPNVTSSAPYAVPTSPTARATVPAHAVYLVVQGRSGPGLGALSALNPNGAVGAGPVSSKTVETIYRITNLGQQITDAVAMSSGDLAIVEGLNQVAKVGSANSSPGRIRSLGNISVVDNQVNNPASIDSPSVGKLLSGSGFNGVLGSGRISTGADPGNGFYSIKWSDVPMAKASGATLPGGTYVVDDSGKLLYFEMTPSAYITWMSDPANAASSRASSGDTVSLPAGVKLVSKGGSPPTYDLRITKDVLVTPSTSGVKDFAFMPLRGAANSPAAIEGGDTGGYESFKNLAQWTGSGANWTASNTNKSDLLALAKYLVDWSQDSGQTMATSVVVNGNKADITLAGGGVAHISTAPGKPEVKFEGLSTIDTPNSPTTGFWSDFQGRLSNDIVALAPVTTKFVKVKDKAGKGNTVTGSTSKVSTDQLSLSLAPAAGKSITLTVPGSVTIGAAVNGTGGSVTSQDDINLYGCGVNLAANPNAANGISLYSQGDINMSTYFQSQIDGAGKATATGYQDVSLKGVMYAWGSISVFVGDQKDTSTWKNFNLTGAMISYGSEPKDGVLPTPGNSSISIAAQKVNLTYDPAYLLNLMSGLPANVQFAPTSWSIR